METNAIEWAKNQVKRLEWNLKHGGKFEQIQARVKLQKINSLTDSEFNDYATASYNSHVK